MTQEQRDIKRKLAVLEHARASGNVAKTARHFGISRQGYYKWKKAYEEFGIAAAQYEGSKLVAATDAAHGRGGFAVDLWRAAHAQCVR